ncbi:MAG: hypothetical protein J0I07_12160 [Myxococcales bacterium]|nr:hypothetical protein [Myxococcales bacterium]
MPKPSELQARRVVPWILVLLTAAPAACTADISAGRASAADGGGGGDLFAPPPTADAGMADQEAPAVAMCVATGCPHPYATCEQPGSSFNIPYRCETDLFNDNNNCGACGTVCPDGRAFPGLNVLTQCVEGACVRQCAGGYQDCNGLAEDGCEVNTYGDPDHCGLCGQACPQPSGGGPRSCVEGKCVGCAQPNTWCDATQSCVDLSSDSQNCGACGNQCPWLPSGAEAPPEHMRYACVQGECGHLVCEQGWSDCNEDESDGCETNTHGYFPYDTKNCGACGKACAPGQACIYRWELGSDRPVCGCEPNTNETLCGDYCSDLLSDIANCGACRAPCYPGEHHMSACSKGICERECMPGWGDCDGDPSNGCEMNLLVDGRHCGSCGAQCDTQAGQPCVDGRCLMVECDAGVVPAK